VQGGREERPAKSRPIKGRSILEIERDSFRERSENLTIAQAERDSISAETEAERARRGSIAEREAARARMRKANWILRNARVLENTEEELATHSAWDTYERNQGAYQAAESEATRELREAEAIFASEAQRIQQREGDALTVFENLKKELLKYECFQDVSNFVQNKLEPAVSRLAGRGCSFQETETGADMGVPLK
jgi:hypothetical protein